MGRKMNARQQKFADLVASGKAGGPAYAKVYKAQGAAADSCATKLLRNAEVSAYIDKIRAKATEKTGLTLAKTHEILERIAEEEDDNRVVIQALDQANKLRGSYAPDKLQVSSLDKFFDSLEPAGGLQNETS
jgi:phage terminase small subunit